jgi:hypothetical protein
MLTTRHAVEFTYTRHELDTLFRIANSQDVEKGRQPSPRHPLP